MRSNQVDEFFCRVQGRLYVSLNKTSEKNAKVGYLFAIPVALIDVTLKLVKIIAQVIEALVLVVFNLIGSICAKAATWAKACHVKDALYYVEKCFRRIVYIPVAALLTPIFLMFQLVVIFSNPTKANPLHEKFALNDMEFTPFSLQEQNSFFTA